MTCRALVLVIAACGSAKESPQPRPEPPPPAPTIAIDAREPDAPPLDAPVLSDAAVLLDAAVPLDAAAKPTPRSCKADAKHCCMPDGRLMPVSGCDPLGGGHGMSRGSDGKCHESFCRCLPGAARIATPHGDVRIDALSIGDYVYTADAVGRRVAMPIVALASVPFDAAHPVHAVTLADGRHFSASAGHPLVDGRLVGALRLGAILDGSIVSEIRTEQIDGPTWDLRPAGPTGTYWADGVHLGSTLRAP